MSSPPPPSTQKNKKEHMVYLSDFAISHLKVLEGDRYCNWVSPNRQSSGSIHHQTLTKVVRDRQRKKALKGRTASNKSFIIDNASWRPHDLRRNAANIMQELDIAPNVVMKCLNQSAYDPLIETYERVLLIENQQEVSTLLNKHLTNMQKST
jgi:integrase